jgi:hypothetical protein
VSPPEIVRSNPHLVGLERSSFQILEGEVFVSMLGHAIYDPSAIENRDRDILHTFQFLLDPQAVGLPGGAAGEERRFCRRVDPST